MSNTNTNTNSSSSGKGKGKASTGGSADGRNAQCDALLQQAEEVNFVGYWNREAPQKGKKVTLANNDERDLEERKFCAKTLLRGPDSLMVFKRDDNIPVFLGSLSVEELRGVAMVVPSKQRALCSRAEHREIWQCNVEGDED